MAFTVPSFNLLCNIVEKLTGYPPWRLTNQPCALVYGRRTNSAGTVATAGAAPIVQAMNLLLPAHTDIRGPQGFVGSVDVVECPAGSGRIYQVAFVDDIGKGWPNEHRTATLIALHTPWPVPYP